jgi:hypothetical protein
VAPQAVAGACCRPQDSQHSVAAAASGAAHTGAAGSGGRRPLTS